MYQNKLNIKVRLGFRMIIKLNKVKYGEINRVFIFKKKIFILHIHHLKSYQSY